MRLTRTAAFALTLSLTTGAVALTAAPALAAVTSPVEDERALRVEQGFEALYAAIDRLTERSVEGTDDAADRAAVDAAVERVLAATEAVRAADPEPKPKKDKDKGDDPVAAAEAKLKAEVDALVKATTSGSPDALLKVGAALVEIPKLAVDLLIKVGLGKLADGMPEAPKLPGIPGLGDAPKQPDGPKVPTLPQLPKWPGLPF